MRSKSFNLYLRYFLISISILILLFIYLLSRDLKTYARKEIDQNNLSISLLKNNFPESRKILYRLIPLYERKDHRDLIMSMFNIVELSSKDVDEAILDFSKLNQIMLGKLAKNSQNLGRLNSLSTKIREKRYNLNKLLASLPDQQRSTSEKINLQLNNLQFILDELNSYLSLPESQLTTDKKGNYVFKEGIFKGLPIIHRLPDNIKNLTEFQNALDAVGGKVKLVEGDMFQEFKDKIKSLKSAANGYTKTIFKLKSELSKTEKEIKNLKEPDLMNLKLWQTRIRMLFLEIVNI